MPRQLPCAPIWLGSCCGALRTYLARRLLQCRANMIHHRVVPEDHDLHSSALANLGMQITEHMLPVRRQQLSVNCSQLLTLQNTNLTRER
jgi:hypothetical protein